MNKHLFILLALIPASFFAMEEESVYRRIAIAAEKGNVTSDLTYEKAIPLIKARCKRDHLEYYLMAFARTYLRMDILKNYKEIKAELDVLRKRSGNHPLVCDFITVMNAANDNWDTANPNNVFRYADRAQTNFIVFFKDDHFLGLKDPQKKEKEQ